jgi:hypothetical protein
MIIQLNIDLMKVDKTKIKPFTRKDGTEGKGYDLVVFLKDETDQFGNDGFVAESVPKDSAVKGAILGNARIAGKKTEPIAAVATHEASDLPF